ncbi:replication initiation protein [Holzapfeliella sp. JNUCC 80]
MNNKIKMGEKTIVKYHPRMNNFIVSQLNSKELDLFVTLITQMKDEKNTLQTINIQQLKRLLNITYRGKKLQDVLEKLIVNLSAVRYINSEKTGDFKVLEIRNIFSVLKLTLDEKTVGNSRLDMKISDDAVSLINDLDRYVLFDLKEFTSISGKNSKIAKILYKYFKQFRTTGIVKIPLEKYKTMLGIDEKYKTKEINRTYVNAPMKKLAPFFKDLKVEKEKDSLTRKITGYTFTFEPEQISKPTQNPKKGYKKRPVTSHKEVATDWSKYALSLTNKNGAEIKKNNSDLDNILSQLDSQEIKS